MQVAVLVALLVAVPAHSEPPGAPDHLTLGFGRRIVAAVRTGLYGHGQLSPRL
jgi:hypothetical protein